jgi:hypothetical protein
MLNDLHFQKRKALEKLINLEGKWYYVTKQSGEWLYYLNGGSKELIRFRFNIKGTFIDQRVICLPFLSDLFPSSTVSKSQE